MRKSKGWLVVFTTIALLWMTACSGTSPGEVSTERPAPAPSGSSERPANPGSAGSEPVKIEYFQMKTETVDLVNEMIEDFHQANGGTILVEQNNVPNPENVWTMRISTDDAPDVFTHYPHNAVFQQLAAEGRILDLTNDPLLETVQPAVIEVSKIGGKNYVVPVALATLGVYYNIDIFEELGLEIPQTYDELIQTAEAIQAAGKTPFMFHDKDWNGIRQEVVFKMGLELDSIEPFLDDVMNGKAHIADHPGIRPLAEKLLALRQYAQDDALGTDYNAALTGFANGEAAMWFTGIWAIKSIKEANPELNFSMFPMPTEQAENAKIQISVDTAIAFPAKGKHPEAAREFVEYMISKESVQRYVDVGGYPAAIEGITNNTKEIDSLNALIEAGKVYPTIERLWPPGVNGEVGKATQEMFVTGDVDAYMEQLETIFFNRFNP